MPRSFRGTYRNAMYLCKIQFNVGKKKIRITNIPRMTTIMSYVHIELSDVLISESGKSGHTSNE